MDEMDTIGRYGTIALIRKNTFESVTSYPVDDERTTFGRDPKCSIRMYFHDVDPLHCTLYFEDGKAYLNVKGTRGAIVDDVHVTAGTTVPLNNSSKFTIWKKMFQFTYPPRHVRARLLATPRKGRKSLRMSMIHSALILTPRIAQEKTLDIRTLQSPLKPYPQAPHETVTFVDTDQIAVVEDGAPTGDAPLQIGIDDEARSLVALEEIDIDEEEQGKDEFSRTPIRPIFAVATQFSPSKVGAPVFSSPQRQPPPSNPMHRRTPSIAHLNPVPPLTSLQSPIRQRANLYPTASPTRVLPPSGLIPRDQWRHSAATGHGPSTSGPSPFPPRTPPRKKTARMSLHKAVVVRSAHRAYVAQVTAREESQDEDEVLEVVSPERERYIEDFSDEDDDLDGDEDADGEDDLGEGRGRDEATPGGVLQTGVNILTSISTFVRKSLSPERKTAATVIKASLNEGEDMEAKQDSMDVDPLPAPIFVAPATVAPTEAKREETQSMDFTLNLLQSDVDSPSTASPEPKEPSDRFSALGMLQSPSKRHWGSFLTPPVPRITTVETFTTVKDTQASGSSIFGKPFRPIRPLNLGMAAPGPRISVAAVPPPPAPYMPAAPIIPKDEEEHLEKEQRAKRRQSALAALDATPLRPLANPSSRKSLVRDSAVKRRNSAIVPPMLLSLVKTPSRPAVSPNKSPLVTGPIGVNPFDITTPRSAPLLIVPAASEHETDITSPERDDETKENAPISVDDLKAKVALVRRESMARASRLSLGLAQQEQAQEDSDSESLIDLKSPVKGHAEVDQEDEDKPVAAVDNSMEAVENAIEVDMTEMEMGDVVTVEEAAEAVQTTDEVPAYDPLVQDLSEPLKDEPTPTIPSPQSSPSCKTRSTKRSAPIEDETISPKKTRRSKAEDDEVAAEEEPRKPLRRGRSATPAAEEAPRTRRAASQAPDEESGRPRTRRATSQAPSEGSSARTTRRSASQEPATAPVSPRKTTRTKAAPEAIVEEPEPEPVEVPKTAPAKTRPPSRIAQAKALPKSTPAKKVAADVPAIAEGARVVRRTASRTTVKTSATEQSTGKASTSKRIPAIPSARVTKPATGTKRAREETEDDVQEAKRSATKAGSSQVVDKPSPKKKRKAESVKEEDPEPVLKKTIPSRMPTKIATATSRSRKASGEHDKENAPEVPIDDGAKVAAKGKGKADGVTSRSLRSRVKS